MIVDFSEYPKNKIMRITSSIKNLLFIVIIASLFNCSKEEFVPDSIEVNDFAWRSMNAYYRWQGEIPDLSDRNFSTREQLNTYLMSFEEETDLFQSLLYRPSDIDSVSIFSEDFTILEEQLKGVIETTGMEFEIVNFENRSDNVFGYVTFVHPGSNAATNGVTRGMIFTEVDGNTLTTGNFRNLLLNNTPNFSITLANNYNNGNPIITAPTVVNLTSEPLNPNPILIDKVFTEGSTKIGYLLYNEFNSAFLSELNIVFANFRTESINDLIIDLRYTSNGNIEAVTTLASLIAGQLKDEVIASEVWNEKVNSNRVAQILQSVATDKLPNGETLNSLGLIRVYFLTSNKTASAAEVLINGLSPLIDVVTIGEETKGVYNASALLYDSEDYQKTNINPNHTYVMLPVVAGVTNKDGLSDKIPATQTLAEDYNNLGVLGEKSDPILNLAIENILNGTTSDIPSNFRRLGNSKENYITNEILLTPLK